MKKLNMGKLNEAIRQGRRGICLAAPPPTPAIAEAKATPAAASSSSSLDPFVAMNAYASGSIDFPAFLVSIPAVNASLESNILDFSRLRLTPFGNLDKAFRQELEALSARLAGALATAQRKMICAFYFLFWLSLHAINVDGEAEAEWWHEQLAAACCTAHLNCVSACIRLLAGQFAEDRGVFLAKLRPGFQQTAARLGLKQANCRCSEGLPQ